MYNIYETHGEPMTKDAKIRFIFKKISHKGLIKFCKAMKMKITTEAVVAVTYTTMANHLSTTVSELPDYLSHHRNVYGIAYSNRSGGSGGNSNGTQNGPDPHHGIFNADVTILTDRHPNGYLE